MRVELQKLNTNTVNDIQFLKIFAISINIYVKFSHVKKVTLTFDDMRKFSNNKEWHIVSAFFLLNTKEKRGLYLMKCSSEYVSYFLFFLFISRLI